MIIFQKEMACKFPKKYGINTVYWRIFAIWSVVIVNSYPRMFCLVVLLRQTVVNSNPSQHKNFIYLNILLVCDDFGKELFLKFNTNTDRDCRKPCLKYFKSGNIKIVNKFPLLANLILHKQIFALLSYF